MHARGGVHPHTRVVGRPLDAACACQAAAPHALTLGGSLAAIRHAAAPRDHSAAAVAPCFLKDAATHLVLTRKQGRQEVATMADITSSCMGSQT